MMEQFRGGPLADGHTHQVHSLIVHMIGDGYRSIGWYEQNVPLGLFEWHPRVEYDEHGDLIGPA